MGHIAGGEDDDIAFGVPIAEHTSVTVRPEGRWRQKRRGWAQGCKPPPSWPPSASLHLGARGSSHTTCQLCPQWLTNMGPAAQTQITGELGPKEISNFFLNAKTNESLVLQLLVTSSPSCGWTTAFPEPSVTAGQAPAGVRWLTWSGSGRKRGRRLSNPQGGAAW